MTTPAERATRAARQALSEAIGSAYTRRQFTVSKFGRHEDGYLHARVVVGGEPFYFTRRYGSWLAPGHVGGKTVLKEPEALLGSQLGSEVKYTLSEKAAPYDLADRKQREEAENARKRPTAAPPNTGGGDPPVRADRLLAGGDSGDADESVQPSGKRGQRRAGARHRTAAIG